MITVRKASERGHFNHGWLDTNHTFSFADYYDEAHMGFRALRVINEDRVAAGRGFGTHAHRDMEIVSYVLEGELAHRDSMGTGSVIRPGEVQRMSAGTGVMHSEMNPSEDEPVHFLQIWILPERRGITPSYEQKKFEDAERTGTLRLVASPDASDGSLKLHQDVRIYSTLLDGKTELSHEFKPDRYGWVQVTRGEVQLNGTKLQAGDGAAIENESRVTLSGSGEVLLFDLN
ncbi:MAG TPA: pirin family protein [Thermoanaerobaculia bacterium]|nr:pirin family protein [Thermoanaerobaculia bacterium]